VWLILQKIDDTNKEYNFGLYANPFEKIAGTGRVLEEVCLKYILDLLNLNKIKLEVFSDNVRTLNLYKKYNFKWWARKALIISK
jgi:UDP-4-amino-4,6-dideoxy-N-acetyl-beta-L-altrosamine N-acetyltransferase